MKLFFSAQFDFLNSTLKSHLEDRLPQKIVVDVGELEGDSSYMVNTKSEMHKFSNGVEVGRGVSRLFGQNSYMLNTKSEMDTSSKSREG